MKRWEILQRKNEMFVTLLRISNFFPAQDDNSTTWAEIYEAFWQYDTQELVRLNNLRHNIQLLEYAIPLSSSSSVTKNTENQYTIDALA